MAATCGPHGPTTSLRLSVGSLATAAEDVKQFIDGYTAGKDLHLLQQCQLLSDHSCSPCMVVKTMVMHHHSSDYGHLQMHAWLFSRSGIPCIPCTATMANAQYGDVRTGPVNLICLLYSKVIH